MKVRDSSAPRQLALVLGMQVIEGLEATERAEAVDLLAQLLLEACGVVSEEDCDEDI